MAGGMSRRPERGTGETLAERVAATRARQAGSPASPVPGSMPSAPPPTLVPPVVKHAWYDGPYGRQPALLLGWRNIQGRFDGRICVAVPDDGGWALVEMWVDGAMLSPAVRQSGFS